jgi:hypothetical protein
MYLKMLSAAVSAVLVTVIAGVASAAHADNLYRKIVNVSDVSPKGEPYRLTGRENVRTAAEGSDFSIDRASGLMLGKYVDNSSDYWNTTVLERGGEQMSYKAFARNKAGHVFAQYLEVKIWTAGAKKPFVLFDNEVFTGYCTL